MLAGTGKPSSELKMHLAVYRRRPEVRAIVHAHPPAATGFAACRLRLDREVVLPEVVFGLGRIGFADYATPTTTEVPEAVEKEIGGCEALLLANHGALTVGEDGRAGLLPHGDAGDVRAGAAGHPPARRPQDAGGGAGGAAAGCAPAAGLGGRARPAAGGEEQALIQTVSRIVLEVLRAQGAGGPPAGR